MIKKSHRKQLDQKSQDVSVDDAHKRFSKAIELINKVHKQIFHIPEGYYICPDCKEKDPLYISNKPKRNVLRDSRGQVFYFNYCNSCEGSGYIDFVSNAMKNNDRLKIKVAGQSLPINSRRNEH